MSKIEIEHGCAHGGEPYVPVVCQVIDIQQQTDDVKSFRVSSLDGKSPFADVKPGQLAMFSVPPYGECMFAITACCDEWVEMAVKKVGFVTERMHELEVGAQVGMRGPYGNWFPFESCKGRDMLFIAGGIGMAPVRSFLRYVLEHRDDYGRVDLVYSGSTYADLAFKDELFEEWPKVRDTHIHVSTYKPSKDWDGAVSYTAPFFEELFEKEGFSTDNVAVTLCGGPSLFRTCRESLDKLGYAPEDIITTLEMRMKCGVGKCGRCNIGGKFICLDGPVFTEAELAEIPHD